MRVFLFFAVKKKLRVENSRPWWCYFLIYYVFSKLSMLEETRNINFEFMIVKKGLHESFGPIVVRFGKGVLWQFNDCENDKISMYIFK